MAVASGTMNPIDILKIIAITLIPTLELRASIPFGIFVAKINPSTVFFIAFITNVILGLLVFIFLDKCVHLLRKNKLFEKLYQRTIEKTQKKIKSKIDRYGPIGLSLFIAIPLPGSGSYTGALIANILKLNKKQFFVANLVGVFLAALAVTIACLTGSKALSIFIR